MTASAHAARRPGLSRDQLDHYRTKGFLLVRGLFDQRRMAALAAEVDGLHERMAAHAPPEVHVSWEDLPPDRPQRIRQLMNSERVSPILDAMSRSDEMLGIMEALIGPDLYLYHSKLLMKAAHDGTPIPWHQDWGYWRHYSRQPTQVNCMLAIDPATEANGAVRFVPGSHAAGAVEHQDLLSSSFNIGLEGGLDAFPNEMMTMEPGDGVFFGALVIHGSGANRSALDRRANTFAYDGRGNQLTGELPIGQHRRGRT
jgi:phytanoyl-CoA hydroxylase